ncbi:FKBP-type peptidyl-prolyl cis-trans isomerase [Litorihabitans aurantiacus]|uniref:Peptidylprolyl isomerase n=1 Tax=Litorihabitans aurantiacus TaxID=1930061 RepID=A0AA37UVA1_9MICO|nr:hypothetical protein [Litorihabitans aurantiacus]GMA31116.1 hypothetical protein GCM10025875_11080 [Litorihabitans aurantiacus]
MTRLGAPRRPARRPAVAAVLAATLAIGALAGCRAQPEPEPTPTATVAVAGEFGVRPTITIAGGRTVEATSSQVLLEGEGPAVVEGQPLLIDFVALDIATGETVADTYPGLPEVRTMSADSLGAPLHDLLQGVTVGSRVELVEIGSAARPTPHVLVLDVLPLRATGAAREGEPGLPTLTLGPDGAPTPELPQDEPPPTGTRFAVTIKGDGPQVSSDQSVVLQLTSVRWSDGAVVDSTWGSAPRSLALSDLTPPLRGALLEQTVGSQILVVAPSGEAGSNETLVTVLDVLATADVAVPTGTEADPSEGTDLEPVPDPEQDLQPPGDTRPTDPPPSGQ